MTVGEAARELKASEQTVRKMADDGRLTTVRTAGGVRILDGAEVRRVAAERRQKRARR